MKFSADYQKARVDLFLDQYLIVLSHLHQAVEYTCQPYNV